MAEKRLYVAIRPHPSIQGRVDARIREYLETHPTPNLQEIENLVRTAVTVDPALIIRVFDNLADFEAFNEQVDRETEALVAANGGELMDPAEGMAVFQHSSQEDSEPGKFRSWLSGMLRGSAPPAAPAAERPAPLRVPVTEKVRTPEPLIDDDEDIPSRPILPEYPEDDDDLN